METDEAGEELSTEEIIGISIAIIFLIIVVYFVVSTSSGELVKKEITAKQLCLAISGSEVGTKINVSTDMILEKQDNSIIIKKSKTDYGYGYECYKNFEISKEEKNTIITVV